MPALHLGSKSATVTVTYCDYGQRSSTQTEFVLSCQQKGLFIDTLTSDQVFCSISIQHLDDFQPKKKKKGNFLGFNSIFDKEELLWVVLE